MSRHPRLVTADAEQPLRAAAAFVALTYLIAAAVYLPLLAADLGWIGTAVPGGLQVVAIASPALATLVLRLRADGVAGLRSVLDGLRAWRFGRAWWAVTLGLPLVLVAGYAGAYVGLGYDFVPEPVRLASEAGPAIVAVVVVMIVLAAGEEIGWRGHLLPLLQSRTTALRASLVLGGCWAVWHLPVFYAAGIEGWAVLLRFVSLFGGAVMYTWLFNNTGGSVLAVTLLHAGTNAWGPLLAPTPAPTPAAAVFMATNVGLAIALVVGFGGATLAGRRRLPGSSNASRLRDR